jgi:hypothetical protein
MGPFFERLSNKNFLLNDFFTNSSSLPNARFIFDYFILFFCKIFNIHWYTIFYIIKILIIIMLPISFYYALYSIISQNLTTIKDKIIGKSLLLISLLIVHSINPIFNIYGWMPYTTFVAPQTLSLIFGLFGIIIFSSLNNNFKYLNIPFWFVSILFHPSIGLFVILFYYISKFNSINLKEVIFYFIFCIILPLFIIFLLFNSKDKISTDFFIDTYIKLRHPHHYDIAGFWNLYKLKILIISMILFFPIITNYFLKNFKQMIISILYLSSFLFVIIIQFFFIVRFHAFFLRKYFLQLIH